MIAILDYGMGNLHSVENALQHIGCTCCVTDKKEDLQRADQLILPGVGAFADCMKHLQERDSFHDAIIASIQLHSHYASMEMCQPVVAMKKNINNKSLC